MSTKSGRSILRLEAVGFAVIIVFTWVVEFTLLPHWLYGDPPVVNLKRALYRSLVIGVIWLWVHFMNRRLLRRLHELEGYLRICSWCRKVGDGERWLTTEEFFGSRLAQATSHGICPACAREQLRHVPVAQRVPPPGA